MWKTRPQPRINPVIARDTTYSVSLLTCTTSRSNFAIPSNEISLHGNGVEIRRVKEDRQTVRARGDSAPAGKIEAQAPGFRSVSRAPKPFIIMNFSLLAACQKQRPEVQFESAVAVPRPSPGTRQCATARVATGALARPAKRVVPIVNVFRWSSPNPGARNGNPYSTSF